jgi:hypothetical protein
LILFTAAPHGLQDDPDGLGEGGFSGAIRAFQSGAGVSAFGQSRKGIFRDDVAARHHHGGIMGCAGGVAGWLFGNGARKDRVVFGIVRQWNIDRQLVVGRPLNGLVAHQGRHFADPGQGFAPHGNTRQIVWHFSAQHLNLVPLLDGAVHRQLHPSAEFFHKACLELVIVSRLLQQAGIWRRRQFRHKGQAAH